MKKVKFKKRPVSCKNNSSGEKVIFPKGSTNRWIGHLCNVFRSAKSIQIQPIIQIFINQRKSRNKIRIWFEISRIFYIYIYIDAISLCVAVWLLFWVGAVQVPCSFSLKCFSTSRRSCVRCCSCSNNSEACESKNIREISNHIRCFF